MIDTLPAGTTFVSLSLRAAPGWIVYEKPAVGGTGKISCSTYWLGAGQSATFTLVVRADGVASGASVTNMARVTSLTPDPNIFNNRKTATTTVD